MLGRVLQCKLLPQDSLVKCNDREQAVNRSSKVLICTLGPCQMGRLMVRAR